MEWQVKTIKDLGKVVTGKTPSKENDEFYKDGELPFVSPKDLDWNSYYVYDTQTKVTDKAYDSQKNQRVPKNSVFYTSLSFAIGKIGIASRESLTNQQIHSIVVNDKHDYKFVYYLLQQYRPYIFCFNSGIDTPIVPKSVFEKINVVVPDLEVQKKIAAILSAYDELIENNKKRIQILENMAEELYKEWFVRFRFPNWENTEFEKGIPKDWNTLKMSEIVGYYIGGGWGEEEQNLDFSEEAYVIRGTDIPKINGMHFSEKVLRFHKPSNLKSRLLQAYDLIFEVSGGSKDQLLGRNLMITPNLLQIFENKVICASFCKLIRFNLDKVNPFFMKYFMKLYYKYDLVGLYQVQSTGISNYQFESFLKHQTIQVPTKSLTDQFEKVVKPLVEQMENLGLQNEMLVSTRNSLLPRLISEKLSVEDLDIYFPPSMQDQ